MKRFYLFCLLVLISFPIQAKNKISMVTYFPVPYVAYSQVNTTDQMDIGLTSTCDMKLGCSETSATLNATRVNLKGGKLNLDGGRGIKGYTLSLGNGNGEGKISFQNVRIQTGNMESVNAADIKAANLNLFGKTFPSCKDANSESNGQMQWASLKLKGALSNELYLMCGDIPTDKNCTPSPCNGEVWADCSHFDSGGGWCYRFTWDSQKCSYEKQGAGGPPTYCSAAKSAMSPYYCNCSEETTPSSKYVWKEAWKQRLVGASASGGFTGNEVITKVNTTLLACKGVTVHSWDEITTPCGSAVAAGVECGEDKLGVSCTKSLLNGSMAEFCEFGGGEPRTGNSVNIPCNENARDSFLYYVNTTLCDNKADMSSWRDEIYQPLLTARILGVIGFVCAPQ